MNTKRDEIDDILQLANGLNGPNRLNLTRVVASARISDCERRLKFAANGASARAGFAVKNGN